MFLRDVQAIIDTGFEQLDEEQFGLLSRPRSATMDGRGVNGTLTPYMWALGVLGPTTTRGFVGGTRRRIHNTVTCTIADVTIPAYRSAELLERFEFGAPELELDVRISNLDLQIGDVITIDDPSYVGYRRSGLDRMVTQEIVGIEYH